MLFNNVSISIYNISTYYAIIHNGDYMYVLNNINKVYKVGSVEYKALNSINLSFSNKGITTLIGKSGSGKTTLLNILGNLDTPTSGDVKFHGKSLSNLSSKQLDSYRNDKIGFIFQHYNLIEHITVYENIKLSLLISDNTEDINIRILSTLDKLGIKDQAYKLPTELSGGQKQRVSIARAIINKPSVLLCDEPTGALDNDTSKNIMDVIKELSKDILVILVTHDLSISNTYSDRIIELLDGDVINDSNPITNISEDNTSSYISTSTSMPLSTIFKLSYNNLTIKLKRTLMTIMGACIGIFLLSTVSSLSNGINATKQDMLQNDLYKTPVTIQESYNTDDYTYNGLIYKTNTDAIIYNVYDETTYNAVLNDISDYYTHIVKRHYTNIGFVMNIDSYYYGRRVLDLSTIPNNSSLYSDYLNLEAGDYPTNENEVLILLEKDNSIPTFLSETFGYSNYSDYIGQELAVANQYVRVEEADTYEQQYISGYHITISGVVSINTEQDVSSTIYNISNPYTLATSGILLTDELFTTFSADAKRTSLCNEYKLLYDNSLLKIDNYQSHEYIKILRYYGCDTSPSRFYIYSDSNPHKEYIKDYLVDFNSLNTSYLINYNDSSDEVIYQINVISSLTIYVISFLSLISLSVSTIMIALITYTSVIERNKEIGILMSIGASKKNIRQLIVSEALIISILAGIIGILLAYLFSVTLNILSPTIFDIDNLSIFSIPTALLFMLLCIVLSIIASFYPSLIATKKNASDILREE